MRRRFVPVELKTLAESPGVYWGVAATGSFRLVIAGHDTSSFVEYVKLDGEHQLIGRVPVSVVLDEQRQQKPYWTPVVEGMSIELAVSGPVEQVGAVFISEEGN